MTNETKKKNEQTSHQKLLFELITEESAMNATANKLNCINKLENFILSHKHMCLTIVKRYFEPLLDELIDKKD